MPTCNETGKKIEILLNNLGVIARVNPAQLWVQHINFMSEHVEQLLLKTKTLKEKENIFFTYIKALNKKQYGFLKNEYDSMNEFGKQLFFKDVDEKGIYIHEPPIYGTTEFEDLVKIVEKHPEWVTPYTYDNINTNVVSGQEYFIKLKHKASNKTSLRSARNLNIKNLPARSTLKKDHKVLFNNNAVRWGRMEINQLFLSKNPDIIEKFMKMYATDSTAREQLIKQLTMPGMIDGKRRNVFNMDVDTELNTSINRKILDKYLNIIGVELNVDIEVGDDD